MATRNLKCIGGLNNGDVVAVEDGQLEVLRQKAIHAPFSRRSAASATATIAHTSYTRREVITPDGKVEYLAVWDQTDAQALRWILEP